MACMGPDCPAAERKGEEVFNRVMRNIERKHGFPSPEKLKDPQTARFYRNYAKSRENLRLAFRDLFLSEACDTW